MLKRFFYNYKTSGWNFDPSERAEKSRYEMFNITILLAFISLTYGLILNTIVGNLFLFGIEFSVLIINALLILSLRKWRLAFDYIVTFFTLTFITLFILLIINSNPEGVKHIWIYTFPALILLFNDTKKSLFWTGVLILLLIITHVQTFFITSYSLYQVGYICLVLLIISATLYFYRIKMDENNALVLFQMRELESFNHTLENKVEEKTAQLQELNRSLEAKVEAKVEEIRQKDAMLLAQSRQAAMGEMLSMIAHQWRQPLSTINLQIFNLKIKSMLNQEKPGEIMQALENISDTNIYLSETIDDFQTFFHPEKGPEEIALCELVQRALNFTEARLKIEHIHLTYECGEDTLVSTYSKEVIQVIINILNNAADELIKVEEKKRQITVIVTTDDTVANITIEDSGNGFKKEILPYIFEPYFSTKEKNGTGLGLYMGKMIIETHLGGKIYAENTPTGAKLTITIPRQGL